MGEPGLAPPPSLTEAVGWVGHRVDDAGGASVGRVSGVFVDTAAGSPTWLVVAIGRLRKKLVPVPVRECAAAAGRVWVAHARETLSSAPTVDARRPLLREHELAICAHYGIGEGAGRAAEAAARPENAVTSQPAV